LLGFDRAWLILSICRWRVPFATRKKEGLRGKAKVPYQATVEDAEDDEYDAEGDESDESGSYVQDFDFPAPVLIQRSVSPHL